MGTITVNVSDETEQLFRETVKEEVGEGKGMLGKAISEAMQKWVEEKKQREISKKMILWMEKGFDMGKIIIKSRNELYDR